MMSLLLKSVWRNVLKGGVVGPGFRGRSLSSNLSELTQCPRAGESRDAVMTSLQAAQTPALVLAAVQAHLPAMTHRHLLQALRSLFELRKAGKIEESDNLVNDPAFGVLCHNFKLHARALDVNEAIEATKVLSYLGMSTNSLLVQTLLQMIRCNINTLGIRQIMFLDFILGRFDEKNHLVDALKLALPLAFQIHLPMELDHEDLPLLRDMLLYCATHDMPDRCTNNVVTGLLLHDQRIDASTAKSIVWSLCNINCTDEVFPTRSQLLHICYDILSHRILDLGYDDVLRTAAKIKGRVLAKHPEYYDANLFDAIGDFVIQKEVNFAKSLLVARILSRIAHTHLRLVEYLCQTAVEDPSSLSAARTNTLFAFVNSLANNNFKPAQEEWKKISTLISSNPILDGQNMQNLPWIKFCLELATLGHFDDRVLKNVFSPEYLSDYTCRSSSPLDYLQILTLHEAVKAFHSTKYELPQAILDKARSMYPVHSVTDKVYSSLVAGLGGSEYAAKNVVLPNGIVADILVCLDKRIPLALRKPSRQNSDRINIEDLKLPSGSIPICVSVFNQGCFSMNSNRLRGTFRLILDILEKQGYIAVSLNVNEWLSAPAHERTPYLMRELDYKCGEIGTMLMVT